VCVEAAWSCGRPLRQALASGPPLMRSSAGLVSHPSQSTAFARLSSLARLFYPSLLSSHVRLLSRPFGHSPLFSAARLFSLVHLSGLGHLFGLSPGPLC